MWCTVSRPDKCHSVQQVDWALSINSKNNMLESSRIPSSVHLGPVVQLANKLSSRRIAPIPDLLKSPLSPALLPNARITTSPRNSYWLVFMFRAGKSFVLLTMQRAWHRKLETDWTPRDNSLVSFMFKVRWGCGRCQWPDDSFPFEIFSSHLSRVC